MTKNFLITLFIVFCSSLCCGQTLPTDIQFVRQASKRIIFDSNQSIPLASFSPSQTIGMAIMNPITQLGKDTVDFKIHEGTLQIDSKNHAAALMWLAGFNPFATYSIDLGEISGKGKLGFQFSDPNRKEAVLVTVSYENSVLVDAEYNLIIDGENVSKQSMMNQGIGNPFLQGKLIFQMLGSGLNLFLQDKEYPKVIGQFEFSELLDLRETKRIQKFQSLLYTSAENGTIKIKDISVDINAGMGLADIRAMTYENGEPILDGGRIWYTMSIRGRGLPNPLQGVFSMNPSVFDIKFEGIIVFDREDGLWRNEVASHIFYDRRDSTWKGITTGFSAYAKKGEKKQLLAVESKKDPRFGFSIMKARPMGQVGDIEDPHIIFDEKDGKYRILTCENSDGYKAIILESEDWDQGYKKIAGPVKQNSTGTSIQRIDGKLYCFSGSSEREIFIYSYPDLKELGTMKMDLPPWDKQANTRVWPNVVELPDGYPAKYIALMMDRINYPGIQGPQWTYGALYLYHGH